MYNFLSSRYRWTIAVKYVNFKSVTHSLKSGTTELDISPAVQLSAASDNHIKYGVELPSVFLWLEYVPWLNKSGKNLSLFVRNALNAGCNVRFQLCHEHMLMNKYQTVMVQGVREKSSLSYLTKKSVSCSPKNKTWEHYGSSLNRELHRTFFCHCLVKFGNVLHITFCKLY